MFDHRNDEVESKMPRKMLCFTIETALGTGAKVGGVRRRVRGMFALCLHFVGAIRVGSFGFALSRWFSLDVLQKRPVCGLLLGKAIADC